MSSTPTHQQQKYFRSIFVPGLYSLQCVSRASGAPDVTVFRQHLDSLIGGDRYSVMTQMRAQKRFAFFVLRHSKERADYYDRKGRLIRPGNPTPDCYPTSMSATAIRCDNTALVQQSDWLIANPTICGSFEAHAGQSAAHRSNFYTMLDQMLNLAKNDKDREHIYMLSHHSPCPRSVLVADLTKASDRAQGVFLDYFKRIRNGWPLCDSHHKTELSRTLSTCRYTELRRWLRMVRSKRNPSDDPQRLDMVLMGLPLSVRFGLAQILVQEVYPKFCLADGGVEQLPDSDVLSHVDQIGSRMDQLLAIPLSNS